MARINTTARPSSFVKKSIANDVRSYEMNVGPNSFGIDPSTRKTIPNKFGPCTLTPRSWCWIILMPDPGVKPLGPEGIDLVP